MSYWLLKTESETFSIDDLERVGKEPWTGVRNFQARNNLMLMQKGDLCLIYHTGSEKAVVGIGSVASEPYADPTQFDPFDKLRAGKKSPYFEPKSTKEKPLWMLVDIKFVKKLTRPVTLALIKRDPKLAGMKLVQAPRLSVQPVSQMEFTYITEKLAV